YAAADVWSLGVTLVEALTQRTPVLRGMEVELPTAETIPALYLEIARRALKVDPSRRASLKEISTLLNPAAAASHRDAAVHAEIHAPAAQLAELPAAAPEPGEAVAIPVAETVAAVEPAKK